MGYYVLQTYTLLLNNLIYVPINQNAKHDYNKSKTKSFVIQVFLGKGF
jgi:hypothetical protein